MSAFKGRLRVHWSARTAACALSILVVCAQTLQGGAFLDRTSEFTPGMADSRAAWGDYNDDGYVDLNDGSKLWRNEGGTNFTQLSGFGQGVWADYDNDGDLDFFRFILPCRIWRYESDSDTFTLADQPSVPMSASPLGASWADFNGDTYVDLYVGGYESPSYQPDAILSNTLGGTVTQTWEQTGDIDPARGITSCDFDEDGDMDVYVSNYRLEANLLWQNDGGMSFANVAPAYGVDGDYNGYSWSYGHTIGSAWGDLDNDGHFDLFVGNFSHSHAHQDRPKFCRNLGPAGGYHFQDKSAVAGLAWQESYASPALGDYDNDGDLDLYFTTVYGGDNAVLYRNDGGWSFTDVTAAEGLGSMGATYQAAWGDFDNDGDLDLVTDGKLYVNQGNSNHWLKVKLRGDGTRYNRAAIGAQVRIRLGAETLSRQVEAGTGQGNQNELTLHFGLGTNSGPVDLEIFWPHGMTQQVHDVSVDRCVSIDPRPLVQNGSGATGVTHSAAWLTGELLSTGAAPASVCVQWGTSTNVTNVTCGGTATTGAVSVLLSGLEPNTTYYYRCIASNDYGYAFATGLDRFLTPGVLPFSETFEERALGDVDYQHGWRASASERATVQDHATHGGSQKACSVSNAALWHAFTPATPPPLVWVTMYLVPRASEGAQTDTPLRASSNTAALFVVDEATRRIVVLDGTTARLLDAAPRASTSDWTRFTMRLDYAAREWDLWMNTTSMASRLGFFSSAARPFRRLRLDAGEPGDLSFVDDISIGTYRPDGIAMVDHDHDGMDDDLEYLYFGSVTNSDGGTTADWDGDGFIDQHELLAGTIPTDPASVLAVSSIAWTGGQFVVNWYSVSSRWYRLQRGSNLLAPEPWATLLSNVAATPPLNSETVTVSGTPAFYRVTLEE